ncbi:hypothetical protein HX900_13550 [Rhizobium sp. WYCCWR 11290]|uniref:Uncharacterized protein n=1 Tax=Rhizobium changzhiense TaxID=2692317 RepID=A0A7Z0RM87_9HYPH|nr:hypothetical protein [Rhizobium changzhiense]NZD62133.1 hypothetical protein [Rhizobium changzhiense]
MSKPDTHLPPWWRVVAAFVLVPLLVALVLACFQPLYAGLPNLAERIRRTAIFYAFFGSYPATILFGVPAYFFLKSRVRATALNCAATGAVVAPFPWLLLGLFSNPDYAYSDGHVTHHNGMKTLWGWVDLLTGVGEFAALGAFAGLVFWCIAMAGVKVGDRTAA